MNTLLSIANGVLQYHRGKQTGLAGLAGIAIALLIAWNWGDIVPILDKLGIVSFFDNLGLIYEGEGGLTGFAILMFFVRVSIFFILVLSALIVLALIFTLVFSSDLGVRLALTIIFLVLAPFLMIWLIFIDPIINKKKNKLEAIDEAYLSEEIEEQLHNPLKQLLLEAEEIPKEQAYNRLNRLPTVGDNLFLLGLTKDNTLYMITPRPLHFEWYGYFKQEDFSGVPISIKYQDKRIKNEPNVNRFEIELLPVEDRGIYEIEAAKGVSCTMSFPKNKIVKFYKTNDIELVKVFEKFASSDNYKDYCKSIQNHYFIVKDAILNRISNELNKVEFEELVERVKQFDAINEDIVRLMWKSEQKTL
ncbi:hypothetical protein [Mesobacillus zeae]|uniref:hypothetical protein n=1 Tax=Mesobacillus zeae TaxID=1917180 RepID=UPI00300A89DD